MQVNSPSTYSLTVRLYLHNPIPNEYSRRTKKPRHSPLLERKCEDRIYTVTVNTVNLHNCFLRGEFPNKEEFNQLYLLDQELLHVAYSHEIMIFLRQSLYIHLIGISSLISLVSAYICPHHSGIHHFGIPYLECRHHVLDLDYLHIEWDIIETNFSLITPSNIFHEETNTLRELKSTRKALQTWIAVEKSVATEMLQQAETSRNTIISENKKLEQTLKGRIFIQQKRLKRIHDEINTIRKNKLFRSSYSETIMAYYNIDTGLSCEWPSRNGSKRAEYWYWSQWYYESCECKHIINSGDLSDECYTVYHSVFNDWINKKWSDDKITKFMFTINKIRYSITLLSNLQTQENLETKRVRRLKQKECMSDSERFVIQYNELQKFTLLMLKWMERRQGFKYIPLDRTTIFHGLTSFEQISLPKIWKQYCDEPNEIGDSLGLWWLTHKKVAKIVNMSLVLNPKLFEQFMLHRKHMEDKLCLIGFHGTGKTSPDIICQNGLDPRYSGTGLHLGTGVYLSASGFYCHQNKYVYETEEIKDGKRCTIYHVLGVLFLPGLPYREPNPNSSFATRRRIAPPGYGSVTGISNNTRIWCIYDSHCYPYCSFSYFLEDGGEDMFF